MIKVLIINTVTFGLNGITSVIMNYFRNMNKANIQIDFLTINEISKEYQNEIEFYGSKIFTLPRRKKIVSYIWGLAKLLKQGKYDIVHVHGNSATMAIETVTAKVNKIPVRIAHVHSTTCSHMKLHKILYPIFSATYTHGFACGKEAGKWLFGDKTFLVLPNAFETEKFQYNHNSREYWRDKLGIANCFVIGNVGTLTEQKNQKYLLEIFSEIYNQNQSIRLLIVGSGKLYEDLEKFSNHLKCREGVIFQEATSSVNEIYSAMDLFTFPSVYEGFGIVMLEAQISGLPCIASTAVPKSVAFDNSVKFLPVEEESISLWCNGITSTNQRTEEQRTHYYKEHFEGISKFDISKNVLELEAYYKRLYKKIVR